MPGYTLASFTAITILASLYYQGEGFTFLPLPRKERSKEVAPRLHGWGITILRTVTGTIFLLSGVEKLFNGPPHNIAEFFLELGSPAPLAVATGVALVEFLCGLALVVGLFTRWLCIPLALLMLGDILLIHGPNGFFIYNDGYEYALLRLTTTIVLVFTGPGKAALDTTLVPPKAPGF
jgi:putative oxidoreductase